MEFLGRADHRVKLSGYRVELGEVEAAMRRVPGVIMAVATVVSVPGASDVLIAAVCVEETSEGAPTVEEIRLKLADLVPAFMIPRHMSVIDSIPFTAGGKIDRRSIIAGLTKDTVAESATPSVPFEAPRTALQRVLADIVAGVLNLGGDAVGLHDDFFSLGGDSVLATQAVARIRDGLDAQSLMVSDFFAARNVAALAAALTRQEQDSDRLELVAEIYLEVAEMPADKVLSALHSQVGDATA